MNHPPAPPIQIQGRKHSIALWVIAASAATIASVFLCGAIAIGAMYFNFHSSVSKTLEKAAEQERINSWNEAVLVKYNEMESKGATQEQLDAFDKKSLNNPPPSFKTPKITQ